MAGRTLSATEAIERRLHASATEWRSWLLEGVLLLSLLVSSSQRCHRPLVGAVVALTKRSAGGVQLGDRLGARRQLDEPLLHGIEGIHPSRALCAITSAVLLPASCPRPVVAASVSAPKWS